MNITTINEILFPLALFFGYFCLACLLVPKQKQAANPTAEIKRSFSAEFDPEPQPQPTLALPPAQARKRNTTAPLTNPVLITPAPIPASRN